MSSVPCSAEHKTAVTNDRVAANSPLTPHSATTGNVQHPASRSLRDIYDVRMRVVALLLMLACSSALATGCSLTVERLHPVPSPPKRVRCTQSRIAPALDAAWSVVGLMGGTYFLANSGGHYPPDADNAPRALGVGALVGTIVFGFASYLGFKETGRCRAYQAASPR